ncbi:MAG: MurR/RpiR family transcriptional regulator [Pseudomonadota bacterium]|nr:MurR/RpiR family transcriptional regulator [Pseudomonadota bacterium]
MTARATTFDELKDAISRAYPTLSPQLQRLSRFAIEKPHDLALGTVAAIAQANAVQPSSMIRFANALGFSGFSQMQQVFQSHLVERSTPRSAPYRERIAQMKKGGPASTEGGVLHRFVGEATLELQQLEDHIDAKRLAAAAALLATAAQIHVLAQRRAFPVACYLAYALSQLELRVQLLDGLGGMLGEFAHGIRAGDALLVASFRNYTPAVVEMAAACRARGVSVLAITDSALSPLKPASDICFELGDDSSRPFRSLVGPLCLAQALVVSTGQALALASAPKRMPRARARSRSAR